jgi:hypothetical protein
MQPRPHRDQQLIETFLHRQHRSHCHSSALIQHPVIADDRRLTHQRRLGAAIADAVLECLKRGELRQGAGAIRGIRLDQMDECVVDAQGG